MGTLRYFFLLFLVTLNLKAFEQLHVEPSVGVGVNSLNMTVNSGTTYKPTNTNYYFLSLGINKLSLQAKFPQKDTQEIRNSRVDSRIQDFQVSLDVYKNWKAAIFYQDYKGYFVENSQMQYGKGNPDLNLNHIGAQLFFVFNQKHSSFLIQDAYWNESEDSSSWIISAGYDRFVIEGDILPTELKIHKEEVLHTVGVNSLTLRGGYSRNWVWSHWFVGAVAGLGYNSNQIDANYKKRYEGERTTASATFLNSIFAFSGGYKWVASKIGFFARAYTWHIGIDDMDISSNTATSGVYYSSTF